MTRIRCSAAIWIMLAPATLCLGTPAFSGQPEFRSLWVSPKDSPYLGYSISADGSTVVGYSHTQGSEEALRWTEATGLQTLGDLPGGLLESQALGVSGDGQVVVGYASAAGGREAFRWTATTGLQSLGKPAGSNSYSTATAISTDGLVIVGYGSSGQGVEPLLWTSGGGMRSLGRLNSLDHFAATVSANGSVVFGNYRTTTGRAVFRWTEADGIKSLFDFTGQADAYDCEVTAISADGSVVIGWRSYIPKDGKIPLGLALEAFRWTAEDGMRMLGRLGYYGDSIVPTGASADASVIVGVLYNSAGMMLDDNGVVWDTQHGLRCLSDVLTGQYGLDISALSYMQPQSISADGQIIIGTGHNSALHSEEWVAILPEPGTLITALIGGTILAARRRNHRHA